MRLILILALFLFSAEVTFGKTQKAKAHNKPVRVVSAKKNFVAKNTAKKNSKKKHLAKADKKKKPFKMSESERKALAKRQVAQARMIASRQQKPEPKAPDFRANSEVIIKDHGFEQTPPTAEEQAVMTAAVTSEDLSFVDTSNGTTPYIDGTAVYVEREPMSDTSSAEVEFEDFADESF